MTDELKIALAQLNPCVGDIVGNFAKIRAARATAAEAGADLVVYSELITTGYPPEDLVLKPAFQAETMRALESLAGETADGGPALLLGTPWSADGVLYNAAVLLAEGRIATTRYKHELPNYGVFDEVRLFAPGPLPGPVSFKGVRLGVMICEDMWEPDVTECLQETGAEILIVINGSPFEADKIDARVERSVARTTESGLPLIYINQVGGQDELVFDGVSFILNADCSIPVQLPAWQERVHVTTWQRNGESWVCAPGERVPHADDLEAIYSAMIMGLRDYVGKNRFPGVIIGLSGGVDSALTAAVCVDALGLDKVHCVMMPSKYTSGESIDDATECARLLGIRYDIIGIAPAVAAFDTMLRDAFAGTEPNTAEENLQARARAITLMAISNKFGFMVVTTGNKSEMSVGYATLYGDLCGGYSVLKDVLKTTVYELCEWRNQHQPQGAMGPAGVVIPANIITKAPSAELKENQFDQDTLPPYDQLDDILTCLVEREMAFGEIVSRGHDPETVARIEHMVYVAEYKRRQAPPGVKITSRNFGRDRRYPITNGYRNARLDHPVAVDDK